MKVDWAKGGWKRNKLNEFLGFLPWIIGFGLIFWSDWKMGIGLYLLLYDTNETRRKQLMKIFESGIEYGAKYETKD